MALTKVFRIELTGGSDVQKDINAIKDAMSTMGEQVKSAKTELKSLNSGDITKPLQDIANNIKETGEAAKQTSLTWKEFVGQRMAQYMQELGGHSAAIKKIAEEWQAYKQSIKGTGDAASQIKQVTNSISEQEAQLKSLEQERLKLETDAKRQAQIEKLLADAKLKEAQATKAQAQADAEVIKSQIAQEKELDRQIALEQKEQQALEKKKRALDALPGSYNEVRNALNQLRPFVQSGGVGGTVAFNGQNVNFDQAIKEFDRLTQAEQTWRRQFTRDGTLVGEYASGIVDAFKRLNIDDIIRNQVTGAKQQLGQLESKTQELVVAYRSAQQQNVTSTEGLAAEIKKISLAYDEAKARGSSDLEALRIKMLELQQAYHNAQTQGSADLNKLEKEIHDNVVETQNLKQAVANAEVQLKGIDGVGRQISTSISNGFKNLKNSIAQFALTYVGFFAAFNQFRKAVELNAELSDSFAQLQIYLHGSKADVDTLVESLKKIPTRTSLEKLVDIATIVAKKGVAKTEIAGVTQALDELFVTLGHEVGDPHEAVASLVKLVNVYSDDKHVTANNILNIGSAIQKLTTSGVATGSFLINFAERLAGVRGITGVSIQNVLGLGAAIEELGQRSEVAGSAASQLIIKLFTDIPKYAGFAGKSVAEFTKTVTQNPVEALIQLAQGLKTNKEGLAEVAQAFDQAGIHGARVIGVLGDIAGNADYMRKRVQDSNAAFGDQASILAANEIKQNTFAATLDNIKKKFELLGTSKGFQITLTAIGSAILFLINHIGALMSILGIYTTIWAIANAQMIRAKIVTIGSNIAFQAQYAILIVGETITKAYTLAVNFLSTAMGRAAASSTILSTAIKFLAGPIGVVLAVIGLLGLSIAAFGRSVSSAVTGLSEYVRLQRINAEINRESIKSVAEQTSSLQGWIAVIKSAASSADTKRAALEKLIAINPAFRAALQGETIDLDALDKAYRRVLLSIQAKARAEAAASLVAEKQKNLVVVQTLRQRIETEGGKQQGSQVNLQEKDLTQNEIEILNGLKNVVAGGDLFGALDKTFAFKKSDLRRVVRELKTQEDEALDTYKLYLKSQLQVDAELKETEKDVDLYDKSVLSAAYTKLSNEIGILKNSLVGLQKGTEEYDKVLSDLNAKEQEREKIRQQLLPKKDGITGETVFQIFERLVANNGTESDFQELLKKIQAQKKATAVTSKEYKDLLELEKKVRELIKPKGAGSKNPEKEKLDNRLKEIDAAITDQKNALQELFDSGQISERDYYIRLRDITVNGEQQKINTILEYQAKYKTALAKFNGELKRDIANYERDQLKAKREANQKLFELENKRLELLLRNEELSATRDRDTTLTNPDLSNEDRLQINEDFYDRMLLAQVVFNQRQIELEKKYGIRSVENEQKRKEAIEKIRKQLEDIEKGRPEARQKDIQAAADRQIAEIRRRVADQTIAILDSGDSYTKKAQRLAELETQSTKERLAEEAAAAKISLEQAKKDRDAKLITEKEYLDKLEEYKTKEAALYKYTTDEQVSATNRFIKALKELRDSFVENVLGIKKYSNDAQGEQERIKDATKQTEDTIKSLINEAYQAYFKNQSDRIERDKKEQEDYLDREKARVEARASSEAEKATIDRQYDQKRKDIEKKASEQQRQLALKKAAIDFAVAVIKTFAQFGFPLGLIPAAALTALYFFQRAQIQKQQFAYGGALKSKEYGLGGKAGEVPVDGGVFGGKPHSKGGTDFTFAGKNYNAEVDEMNIIRTRNAPKGKVYSITGSHTQIASALNTLGGGKSFSTGATVKKMAMGGYLGSQLKAPSFNAGYYLNGGNVGGQGTTDRIDRLEKLTEQILGAVYATDSKEVVLNPKKVTTAQTKTRKDIKVGTI